MRAPDMHNCQTTFFWWARLGAYFRRPHVLQPAWCLTNDSINRCSSGLYKLHILVTACAAICHIRISKRGDASNVLKGDIVKLFVSCGTLKSLDRPQDRRARQTTLYIYMYICALQACIIIRRHSSGGQD